MCVTVSKMTTVGQTAVKRSVEQKLPTMVFPFANTENGYGCQYLLGLHEAISRGGKTLVSNQPGYATTPWSAGYVRKFMTDNDVGGPGHYQCLHILRAVLRGSLETLTTTEVTAKMLEP